VVDKDGKQSRLDEMSRQQIYFLTVEPDDFQELLKSPRSRLASTSSADRKSVAGSIKEEEGATLLPLPPKSATTAEETSSSKPFQFSDFATSQPGRPGSPNVSEDSDLKTEVGNREEQEEPRLESVSSGIKSAPVVEGDEEVFRVATQAEMNDMMTEYRSRKGGRTMPSSSSSKGTPPSTADTAESRRNPFLAKPKPPTSPRPAATATADADIAAQQNESLSADSRARLDVWTELVLVLLNLAADLSEDEFRVLLPALYPGVRSLTAFAKDDRLKQRLADFFQRVASIFGFNAES